MEKPVSPEIRAQALANLGELQKTDSELAGMIAGAILLMKTAPDIESLNRVRCWMLGPRRKR